MSLMFTDSEMSAITPEIAGLSDVNDHIFEAEFSRICSERVINGGEIESQVANHSKFIDVLTKNILNGKKIPSEKY